MSESKKKLQHVRKKRKGFQGTKPVSNIITTVKSSGVDIVCQQGEQQQQELFNDDNTNTPSTSNATISSEKVHPINIPYVTNREDVSGYRFIDLEILNNVMKIMCCPACYGALELVENIEKKKGLASLLIVKCHCGYSHEFYTSSSSSHQSFDINKRAVYTFRALGQGYSGIPKFTSLMNMPTAMTHNNYD